MPALTFMQRTNHRNQNWGVRHAVSTETWAVVTSLPECSFGSHPAGFQSGGGTRISQAPRAMERA